VPAMELVVVCEDVDTKEFPVVADTPGAREIRRYVMRRGVPNCGIAFWTGERLVPQYGRREPAAARLAAALDRFERVIVWGDDHHVAHLSARFPTIAHKIVNPDGAGPLERLLARYDTYPIRVKSLPERAHPLAFVAWAAGARGNHLDRHELDRRVRGYDLADVVMVGDGILVAIEQGPGPVVSVEEPSWRAFCMRPLRVHYPFMGDCYVIGDNGAVGAVDEPEPMITPRELAYVYHVLGVDAGFALDHIPHPRFGPEERARRVALSRDLTYRFLDEARPYAYRSFAIAHGTCPPEIGDSLRRLLADGIRDVAIAVRAIRSDRQLVATLETNRSLLRRCDWVHFLGVRARRLAMLGVVNDCRSFDTSGALMNAFASYELLIHKQRCMSFYLPPISDVHVERTALDALAAYERHELDVESVLDAVREHWLVAIREKGVNDHWDRSKIRRVLQSRFWETCPCPVCRSVGIAVVLHRSDQHQFVRAIHNYWTELQYLKVHPDERKPAQIYLL
jgi:hypothetical protein